MGRAPLRMGRALLMAAAIVVALSRCSNSSHPTTLAPTEASAVTSTTVIAPTTANSQVAATQLSSAEDTANKAAATAQAKLNNNSTIADIQAAIVPLVPAIQMYSTTLTNIDWPPAAVADAHALVSAVANYLGILETVSVQTVSSLPTWVSQLSAALQQERAAANILRHDVGLPPLPVS